MIHRATTNPISIKENSRYIAFLRSSPLVEPFRNMNTFGFTAIHEPRIFLVISNISDRKQFFNWRRHRKGVCIDGLPLACMRPLEFWRIKLNVALDLFSLIFASITSSTENLVRILAQFSTDTCARKARAQVTEETVRRTVGGGMSSANRIPILEGVGKVMGFFLVRGGLGMICKLQDTLFL